MSKKKDKPERGLKKESREVNFEIACYHGDLGEVQSLIKKTFNQEDEGLGLKGEYNEMLESGFVKACENGHLEVIRWLTASREVRELGFKIDIHAHFEEGFRKACKRGHAEVVKFLATDKDLKEAGYDWVNIHESSDTIGMDEGLRDAISNGHLEVVKFLIDSRELKECGHRHAEIHLGGDWCFERACEKKYWNIVEWLVMDYRIKKTNEIKKIIRENARAENYFKVRDEEEELKEVLGGLREEKSGRSEPGLRI